MKDLKPFLLYPYAPILHRENKYPISFIDMIDRLIFINGVGWAKPEECQISLKKLSSITEEDKRELARLIIENKDYALGELTVGKGAYLVIEVQDEDGEKWNNIMVHKGRLPYKAADYLRENSYDIDGYLETGKAIENLNKEEA